MTHISGSVCSFKPWSLVSNLQRRGMSWCIWQGCPWELEKTSPSLWAGSGPARWNWGWILVPTCPLPGHPWAWSPSLNWICFVSESNGKGSRLGEEGKVLGHRWSLIVAHKLSRVVSVSSIYSHAGADAIAWMRLAGCSARLITKSSCWVPDSPRSTDAQDVMAFWRNYIFRNKDFIWSRDDFRK